MSVVLGIHMVQVYIDVGGPTEHWMVKRYPRLPHQRRRILLPVRGATIMRVTSLRPHLSTNIHSDLGQPAIPK